MSDRLESIKVLKSLDQRPVTIESYRRFGDAVPAVEHKCSRVPKSC